MKSEYQIVDELTRFLISWRSQCGAMGWYQMDEKNLKDFVTKCVNEVKNNFIQSDVMLSLPSVAELREINKDRPDTFMNGALYIIDLIERKQGNGA